MKRLAGVLAPISCLPSRFGIGDFGEKSFEFVDLLSDSGFHLWQILPLNPLGYGHSPYQPFSSYAIDEIYSDLDSLFKKGLISKAPSFREKEERVDYELIRSFKGPYLKEAFQAALKKDPHDIDDFVLTHPWVKNWAIFMSMKRSENNASWNDWPIEKINKINAGYEHLSSDEKEAADYEIWLQKNLYEEWFALKEYANSKGIRIVGDLPFYCGYDSCDVYEAQDEFLLDENRFPAWVAGVPPDYFSKTGQRWGNPIYNWEELKKNNYSLLLNRIKNSASLYDIVRLDHFRAFDTYWKIKASCDTAIEGSWVEAPGYDFFNRLFLEAPNITLLAEDLGELRPEVYELRDHYNFPGMNVIQFTFLDSELRRVGQFKKENLVAYLGTHDNDTMKGFYVSLSEKERGLYEEILETIGFKEGDFVDKMIEYELSLPAKYALLPLQDILKLGSDSRLNTPGFINTINWTWRICDFDATKNRFLVMLPLLKKYQRL